MAGGRFQFEDFSNPPKKVQQMFAAVTERIAEGADTASLKVQEIADRAGIGKGTVYEYFSTKEGLITAALIYEYAQKIEELRVQVEQMSGFRDKMYKILDWLNENRRYHMTFIRMIQISTGGITPCWNPGECIPEEVFGRLHDNLCESGDAIMEQGYREGVFTETDVMKRRLAMATMVFQFAMTLGSKTKNSIFVMDYEVLRPFAYESMVKTLNRI